MDPIRTFNVVFEIDNVLADTEVSKADEIKFYEEKGFVLTAEKTHYIFPGVIEMMQLLFNMPDVKVSFFSSGYQTRNELFVEKLLERSLGKEHYLQIKGDVQILSGEKVDGDTDLVKKTDEESIIQYKKYGLYKSINAKPLEKIITKTGNLEDCVYIDVSSTWISCGQESNHLHAPPRSNVDLAYMKQSNQDYCYDEDGQRKIPFSDCTPFRDTEHSKIWVINSRYISLIFDKEKCTLGFVNVDKKQYEEIEISEESHEDIFRAVKKHYQRKSESEENNPLTTLTKDQLDAVLYGLIESKNGKTVSIDLACNHICYVAGLLFKAMEVARSGSTLAKFLFPLHFFKHLNSDSFEPLFQTDTACHKRDEYYYDGLDKLKQANPNFTFISPKDL